MAGMGPDTDGGLWWLILWSLYPAPIYPHPAYLPPAIIEQRVEPTHVGLPPVPVWYFATMRGVISRMGSPPLREKALPSHANAVLTGDDPRF
jgi:hypothetical protein